MCFEGRLEAKPKTSEKQVGPSKKLRRGRRCSLAACFCTFPREIIDDRDQYKSVNNSPKHSEAQLKITDCEQLVRESQSENLRPILHFICPTEFDLVRCALGNCPMVEGIHRGK